MEDKLPKKLLTAKELAKPLGVGVGSVYRMAANGSIPFYAVGPRKAGRRFDLDEVRKALRRTEIPSQA